MSAVRFHEAAARAIPVLALLGAASILSCDQMQFLSRSQSLRIALPDAPESWAFLPDLRMALSWRGQDGGPRSEPVRPGAVVVIEVERGRPQEILALPSSKGRALRPAGALYPEALALSASADSIALDWMGGYVASVALALEGAGVDPRIYDLGRLSAEASRRSADPWVLSSAETALRLLEDRFRATAFDEPDRRRVALPGEGPWVPESPFASAPSRAAGAEAALEADLPVRLWRFVGVDEELFVSVGEAGVSGWVLRSPTDRS